MTFPCPHCGAAKQALNGLCPKCSRFSNIEPSALPAPDTIARAWVQSWDQHIGADGAVAVMNALDAAGYKIVRKDDTEQMLERVKALHR